MDNIQENGVHKLYKKLGETPRESILRYKTANPDLRGLSMTYVGRLDPMAEGLLLVLSGEAISEKEKYLNLPKIYEFEILWEFETDTADILGLVKGDDISIFPTESDVEKNLKNFSGKFEQLYPAYSSQPVDGPSPDGGRTSKPLIQWSREGRIGEIKIPAHEVEIFSAEYISRRFETGGDLLKTIQSGINLVLGDFRQEKILKEWQNALMLNFDRQYAIDKIKINVSGGFYVRQLVSDLAKSLGAKACVFHILRTEIGEYKIEEK